MITPDYAIYSDFSCGCKYTANILSEQGHQSVIIRSYINKVLITPFTLITRLHFFFFFFSKILGKYRIQRNHLFC